VSNKKLQDVTVVTSKAGTVEVGKRDLALGKIEGIDTLARQFEEVGDLGYFIFDAVIERFLYVSSGFGRIYGVGAKDYMEKIKSLDDDLAQIVREDRERVLASYQENLCRGVNCVVEYRIRRSDGKIRWLRESSQALQVENGKVMLTFGAIQDITSQLIFGSELFKAKQELEKTVDARSNELAETEKQLRHETQERERLAAEIELLSKQDRLTGLPLLSLCEARLDAAINESKLSKQRTAVLFIGLDDFKAVNDSCGRANGDWLLKKIAGRLKSEIRDTDTLARVGGDEFVLILCALGARQEITRLAGNIVNKLKLPYYLDGRELNVSGSIGIAVYPDDGGSAAVLIGMADKAMYRVKKSGKNGFGFIGDSR